ATRYAASPVAKLCSRSASRIADSIGSTEKIGRWDRRAMPSTSELFPVPGIPETTTSMARFIGPHALHQIHTWRKPPQWSGAMTKPAKPQPCVIRFYAVKAEYGELSNFAPYPITLRGKRWPTSEHFFQAQKFASSHDQEAIRAVSSPMIAARMGRDRKRKLR